MGLRSSFWLRIFGAAILASIITFVAGNCGQQTFSSDTGAISFSSSVAQAHCTYEVKTKNNTRIVLRWKSFKIDSDMPDCINSAVTVYVGCSAKKLIKFCSKNTASPPHDVYTIDNCLKLVYSSSKSSKEEFSASYFTAEKTDPVSTSSFCPSGDDFHRKSGVIFSPGWPSGYGRLWNDCEWDLKMPFNYLLVLSFMDVDVYYVKTGYSCKHFKERLIVEGEKTKVSSTLRKYHYCGKFSPFSKATNYYEMEIKFKTSGYPRPNRGFMIGYIAYERNISRSKISIGGYVGIGIGVAFFLLCCSLCLWIRYRRR
eukprot:gene8177-9054_t